ncbi:MAG: PH domain-containing protein [Lachnospirales bacterium]
MKVFIFLSFLSVIIVHFFQLYNYAKFKRNICVGATLPHEARYDKYVAGIIRVYKNMLIIFTLGIMLIMSLFFLADIEYLLFYTINISLLIIGMLMQNIPFILTNNKLKAYKYKKGWVRVHEKSRGSLYVNTVNKINFLTKSKEHDLLYIMAIIVSFIPLIANQKSPSIVDLIMVVATSIFYFAHKILTKLPCDAIENNSELNKVITHIRNNYWSRMTKVSIWVTAGLAMVLGFIRDEYIMVISVIIYTVLIVAFASYTEFSYRVKLENLTRETGKKGYIDEDKYWIWGMIYYNPDNRRIFINNRISLNMTANMGRTSGKIISLFFLLILLSAPVFSFSLYYESKVPVDLYAAGGSVVASQVNEFEIPIKNIKDIELINEIPSYHKITGASTDSLKVGKFYVDGYGESVFNLNPEIPPFLLLQTVDRIYFLNSVDSDRTINVYNSLSSMANLNIR